MRLRRIILIYTSKNKKKLLFKSTWLFKFLAKNLRVNSSKIMSWKNMLWTNLLYSMRAHLETSTIETIDFTHTLTIKIRLNRVTVGLILISYWRMPNLVRIRGNLPVNLKVPTKETLIHAWMQRFQVYISRKNLIIVIRLRDQVTSNKRTSSLLNNFQRITKPWQIRFTNA